MYYNTPTILAYHRIPFGANSFVIGTAVINTHIHCGVEVTESSTDKQHTLLALTRWRGLWWTAQESVCGRVRHVECGMSREASSPVLSMKPASSAKPSMFWTRTCRKTWVSAVSEVMIAYRLAEIPENVRAHVHIQTHHSHDHAALAGVSTAV